MDFVFPGDAAADAAPLADAAPVVPVPDMAAPDANVVEPVDQGITPDAGPPPCPSLGEPCETELFGPCRSSLYDCVDDVEVCPLSVSPSEEICDGQDNDCNGAADDVQPPGTLCQCLPGETSTCYEGPDGSAGIGACIGGELTCQPDGLSLGACEGQVVPIEEVCNGTDDDCDGDLDEDALGAPLTEPCYSGAPDEAGVGVCRGGVQTCSGGEFGTCSGEILPSAETCDGLDNDCDSLVDNRADGIGCVCVAGAAISCYPGPEGTEGVGRCRPGLAYCLEDQTGIGACLRAITPVNEVCNALDDDCDGEVDEAACVNDNPSFCADRALAGARDTLCEDFTGRIDDWTPEALTAAQAGSTVFDMGTSYVTSAEAGEWGHNRGTVPVGPAFRMGYSVKFLGGTAGFGLFESRQRDEEGVGSGYLLQVRQAGDIPEIRLRKYPVGAVLAKAEVPSLSDGLWHRVEATRNPDGGFDLTLDGIALDEVPRVLDLDYRTLQMANLTVVGIDAPQRTRLDNVTVESDVDGDGVFSGADVCPDVADPLQLDLDANGVGTLCDDQDDDGVDDGIDGCRAVPDPLQLDSDEDGIGDACDDGGVQVLVTAGPHRAPWGVELSSGNRWRVLDPEGGALRFVSVDPAGTTLAYLRNGEFFYSDLEGFSERSIDVQGHDPVLVSESLLIYSNLARTELRAFDFTLETSQMVYPIRPRELVRLSPQADGRFVLVSQRTTANGAVTTTAALFDPATLVPGVPVAIPSGLNIVPDVAVLDEAGLDLVVAVADGEEPGLWRVEPDEEDALRVEQIPAERVSATPDGLAVVVLEAKPALGTGARRLLRYPVDGGRAVVLMPPTHLLEADTLQVTAAFGTLPPLDRDGDRVVNAADVCPDVPNLVETPPTVLLPNVARSRGPVVRNSGNHFGVAWVEGNGNDEDVHFRRVGLDGQPLGPAMVAASRVRDPGTYVVTRPQMAVGDDSYMLVWTAVGVGREGWSSQIDTDGQRLREPFNDVNHGFGSGIIWLAPKFFHLRGIIRVMATPAYNMQENARFDPLNTMPAPAELITVGGNGVFISQKDGVFANDMGLMFQRFDPNGDLVGGRNLLVQGAGEFADNPRWTRAAAAVGAEVWVVTTMSPPLPAQSPAQYHALAIGQATVPELRLFRIGLDNTFVAAPVSLVSGRPIRLDRPAIATIGDRVLIGFTEFEGGLFHTYLMVLGLQGQVIVPPYELGNPTDGVREPHFVNGPNGLVLVWRDGQGDDGDIRLTQGHYECP